MRSLLPFVIVVTALLAPAGLRADEASHRKATETLLNLMDIETLPSQSVDQMLQVQTQQNPRSLRISRR